jgi:hypothetical protein
MRGKRSVTGACDWFRGRPIPSSRFSTAFLLGPLGNRHGEFHPWFLALTIAGSRSANKGCAAEPLRVNSPPQEPMYLFDYN